MLTCDSLVDVVLYSFFVPDAFQPYIDKQPNNEFFEVLSKDVTKETQVITEGKGLVKEGSKVNAVLEK